MTNETTRKVEEIVAGFIRESGAYGDWTDFRGILVCLRHEFPGTDDDELNWMSFLVVRQLQEAGFTFASCEGGEYAPWQDQSGEAVAARIRREWDALGRQPEIGDICWFRRR
ncbi:hypothetical protein [Parvibaculum sp. MBR-TMA-1.3b-4.2]|jgi:hypothetical protein